MKPLPRSIRYTGSQEVISEFSIIVLQGSRKRIRNSGNLVLRKLIQLQLEKVSILVMA